MLFESFNIESIGSFLVGLGVLTYTSERLHLSFGIFDFIWLAISTASGGVILLSVFTILASVSFHFEDKFGISPPFYNMIAFGRYPSDIFSKWLQFFLRWIVPFAFVAFYPSTHFLQRPEFKNLCYLSPVVAFVFVWIAARLWVFGVSRYSSTGS